MQNKWYGPLNIGEWEMQLHMLKGDGSIPSLIKITLLGKIKRRTASCWSHITSRKCITYEKRKLSYSQEQKN